MKCCKKAYREANKYCNLFRCPCLEESCRFYGVMTKADRIRAMSDEELAVLITNNIPMHAWFDSVRKIFFGFEDHRKDKPKRAWLEWLKMPVEE